MHNIIADPHNAHRYIIEAITLSLHCSSSSLRDESAPLTMYRKSGSGVVFSMKGICMYFRLITVKRLRQYFRIKSSGHRCERSKISVRTFLNQSVHCIYNTMETVRGRRRKTCIFFFFWAEINWGSERWKRCSSPSVELKATRPFHVVSEIVTWDELFLAGSI